MLFKISRIFGIPGLLILSFAAPSAFAEDRKTGFELAESFGCINCHGATGISKDPLTPNLAGQKFKYLKKQTDMFKSGKVREFEGEIISNRSHSTMTDLAQSLSTSELNRIIHYYSKMNCRVKPVRKITEIIPEAKRCEACHGGLRSSPFRDSPNLAGQKQQYMLRQLQQMSMSATDENGENSRNHRLSELMTEGLTYNNLVKVTGYYEDMGCP